MARSQPTRRQPESEAGFLAAVRELAARAGWLAYHTHDSRRSEAGFPDLVLVRRGRMLLVELKAEGGRLTDEQQTWLAQLARVAGESAGAVDVHVWRPSDWQAIEALLTRRAP